MSLLEDSYALPIFCIFLLASANYVNHSEDFVSGKNI